MRMLMPLHNHLFEILPLDSRTIVLTELEVLLFNNYDCSIQCIKALPEISADISVAGEDLAIRLMDDRCLILNLKSYKLKEAFNVTAPL
jgi:hypothetical protein